MGKLKDTTIPDFDQHSHDPLCPCETESIAHACRCDLIERVREDERGAALRDAVTAIEADSEFDDVRDEWHAVKIIEALMMKQ